VQFYLDSDLLNAVKDPKVIDMSYVGDKQTTYSKHTKMQFYQCENL